MQELIKKLLCTNRRAVYCTDCRERKADAVTVHEKANVTK